MSLGYSGDPGIFENRQTQLDGVAKNRVEFLPK
jgi:hypothetical protein